MVEQSELAASWSLITDDASLAAAAAVLADGTGPAGIDAERASGYRYGQDAYLVQVYRRDAGTFLFDPTEIESFAPLADAIGAEEWILHAASQDIPCLDNIGLRPTQLFDTELAARLLGFEKVGLGSIVEELLGIHLEKAHSAADWSTRPLPENWLEYAALDVVLLPDLRDAVAAELHAQGKDEIARQEFNAARFVQPKPRQIDPWRKTSGSHKLHTQRELAIVRELWNTREELAKIQDTAPGRLIPDASIVAAAAAAPRSSQELSRLRTFRGRESRTELDRWWRAVLRAKTTEDLPELAPKSLGAVPHHRSWAQRRPEAARRLVAARASLEEDAKELGMPLENLLTPKFLRDVAWDPPADGSPEAVAERLEGLGAREWQRSRTAPLISAAFVDVT